MNNQHSDPPPDPTPPPVQGIPQFHPVRAFVALTPDPEFVPAFAQLQSELQRSVSQAFAAIGGHREEKPFHPHLTVGRAQPGTRRPRLDWTSLSSPPRLGRWHVRSVDLMRSELNPAGARHSLLHRGPLTPRRP